MNRFFSPRRLTAALVGALGISLASAVPAAAPVALQYRALAAAPAVEITARDVRASNQKARMAHSASTHSKACNLWW